MRVFFCKYNDPPYVKVEKLEIMVRLASEANVGTLLSELKECVFHPFSPFSSFSFSLALVVRLTELRTSLLCGIYFYQVCE